MEGFLFLNRKITSYSVFTGSITYFLYGLVDAAALAASSAMIFYTLWIIFMVEEGKSKDTKTLAVAMTIGAALISFVAMFLLAGVFVPLVWLLVVSTACVIYLAVRLARTISPQSSRGLVLVVILPFGCLPLDALRLLHALDKKKAGPG